MWKDIIGRCFLETDTYSVLARGIGLLQVFAYTLELLTIPRRAGEVQSSSNKKRKVESLESEASQKQRPLYIVINGNKYFDGLLEIIIEDGYTEYDVPRKFDSDVSVIKRQQSCSKGGIFFVTSRVFVVDLLRKICNVQKISGILVYRAHEIKPRSTEVLILNIFKQNKQEGAFVKCFSDSPTKVLQYQSSLNKLSKAMRSLKVEKLILWPRFEVNVKRALSNMPSVTEHKLKIPPAVRSIQISLEGLKQIYFQEMKALCKSTKLESAEYHPIDFNPRKILKSEWRGLSLKAKNLVYEYSDLQRLLRALMSYDAAHFYLMLLIVKNKSLNAFGIPKAMWLMSDEADVIFKSSKLRLYKIVEQESSSASKIFCDGREGKKQVLVTTNETNYKKQCILDLVERLHSRTVVIVKDEKARKMFSSQDSQEKLFLVAEYTFKQYQVVLIAEILRLKIVTEHEEVLLKKILALNSRREKYFKELDNDPHLFVGIDFLLTDSQRQQLIKVFEDTDIIQKLYAFLQSSSHCKLDVNIRLLILYYFKQKDKIEKEFHSLVQNKTDTNDNVSFISFEEVMRSNILSKLQPLNVILTYPSLNIIRILECYNMTISGSLQVHFVRYKKILAESLFKRDVKLEEEAFERLLEEKSRMVPVVDNKTWNPDRFELIRKFRETTKNVVVDIREFMSDLPVVMYEHEIKIIPSQIEVGDYILSPALCVERKSLADLLTSLNSGRLFKQVKIMKKYYASPLVLLEFETFREWQDLQSYSKETHRSYQIPVWQKLILIHIFVPAISYLWSHSNEFTAKLFITLKESQLNPDIEDIKLQKNSEDNPSKQILLRLPGVTTENIYKIIGHTKCLSDLASKTEVELQSFMSRSNAKKLYKYLNYTMFTTS